MCPRRHLLSLPRGRGPSQTPKFLSPGPPSPWLPALLIGKPFCRFCVEPQAFRCAGYLFGKVCKCRRRFNAGVPGAEPPAKKTKNHPLPAGKGVGGMGERKQAKGRVGRRGEKASPPCGCRNGRGGRRQEKQAPRRVPQRQGQLATNRDKFPPGAWFAPFPSAARGKPPLSFPQRQGQPVPPGECNPPPPKEISKILLTR